MENRVRYFFLVSLLIACLLPAGRATAQSEGDEGQDALIEPQVERATFDEALINTDDFELAAYFGFLAVEDFGTNSVRGLKIGYHVSEDFFVQLSHGISTVGETSFEVLSGGAPLLSGSERDLDYTLIGLGFNLLPGEAFFSDKMTFNTVFYLSGGMGSTTFGGEDHSTITYGFGYRTLFANGFSVDIETRNLIFDVDLFGSNIVTNNLELSLSLNLFF